MVHIIQIGNSFGVRIPKAILQQAGFNKSTYLTLKITQEGLLISPEKKARYGWEEQFKSSGKTPKKSNLLGEFSNEFDQDEWIW